MWQLSLFGLHRPDSWQRIPEYSDHRRRLIAVPSQWRKSGVVIVDALAGGVLRMCLPEICQVTIYVFFKDPAVVACMQCCRIGKERNCRQYCDCKPVYSVFKHSIQRSGIIRGRPPKHSLSTSPGGHQIPLRRKARKSRSIATEEIGPTNAIRPERWFGVKPT